MIHSNNPRLRVCKIMVNVQRMVKERIIEDQASPLVTISKLLFQLPR
jgi:hypothetical protein